MLQGNVGLTDNTQYRLERPKLTKAHVCKAE